MCHINALRTIGRRMSAPLLQSDYFVLAAAVVPAVVAVVSDVWDTDPWLSSTGRSLSTRQSYI